MALPFRRVFFREIRDKINITFRDGGKKIQYVQPKSYVFQPQLSNGSEEDYVMALNLFSVVSRTAVTERGCYCGWRRVVEKARNKAFRGGGGCHKCHGMVTVNLVMVFGGGGAVWTENNPLQR